MTVAIMQPYFFPYPAYFRLAHAADVFVVYGEAQYMRGGYVNRNRIDVAGADRWLTLPVERGRLGDAIRERRVDGASFPRWRRRTMRTFRLTYAKAPYLEAAAALLDGVLACGPRPGGPSVSVGDVAAAGLREVCGYLGIGTRFAAGADLDYDRALPAAGKVLGMCRALGATRYVNAAGGRDLYHADAFAAAGLELRFVGAGRTLPPPYRPDLSILDALCKFSPATLRDALSDYALDT